MPFAFSRAALRNHWVVVGALAAAVAVTLFAERLDIFGVDLSPLAQSAVGGAGAVLLVYGSVRVLRRQRSDDPALWTAGDDLCIHVHPGRRIRLSRSEVRGVTEVTATPEAAQRFLIGDTHFRIVTTHTGMSAMRLRVGSAVVEAELASVRDEVVRWWSAE